MTIERIIRILAGIMILLSLGLAYFTAQIDLSHLSWLWLTVLIGLNLLQSGFTGFCPPEKLLKKMGFQEGGSACCK
jgi:hypothetical protein